MTEGANLLVPLLALLAIAIILVLSLVARPNMTRQPGGKILAFVALFLLPALGLWQGFELHVEQAKQREFCLSCHIMEPYGRSLNVDDDEFVPAAHFQNKRIPRDQACYTCHTTYTMFGDVNAKLRGLKHLQVQFLGHPPDTIKLYTPFNNRECMHCHSGARQFESNSHHHESDTSMTAMRANRLSCMTSGCHDVIHDVHHLEGMDMWSGPRDAAASPAAAPQSDEESGDESGADSSGAESEKDES